MTDDTLGPGTAIAVDGVEGAEGTRDRILAEAIEMFTRHGYHRTTLRLLADRLGITKAAILYHFPAKDRIIVALMDPFVVAIEEAIEHAAAIPFPDSRRVLLDGILDAYLANQQLLLMARTDASIFTHEETYQRFMRMPGRVIEIMVGPDAPLEDKVWAVQLMGTLGDSVLFFGDAPKAELREAILQGTLRLLVDGPPSHTPEGPRIDITWQDPRLTTSYEPTGPPHTGGVERLGSGRRVGRPRALSGERIERAKEMYASGAHNVDAIAAELGVSRATVYRYLN
ncbi:TetR family transcriptional regulator [Virgisporangium ochraceum]|nr:TetR family transcriptional regulator [Virgisporangium ochraceum]